MTRQLIHAVTDTNPYAADQWADVSGARLTRDEWREALSRLADVPDLVGPLPAEIAAMLQTLIHQRGDAAAFLLRALRSLDEEARR